MQTTLRSFQLTGFSQYPSLRTVVLHDYRMLTMDFPWARITTLVISGSLPVAADDLLMYLRAIMQCPSLQTLNIEPPDLLPLNPLQDKSFIVTLPDLKYLDTSLYLMLDHTSLPQLERARLSTDDLVGRSKQCQQDFIAAFSRMVSCSQCALRLKCLSLGKIPITKDLVPLLLATKSLEELDIRAEMAYDCSANSTFGPVLKEDAQAMDIIMSLVDILEIKPGEDVSDSFLPKLRYFPFPSRSM
ncbi:hypothetical protein BDZ89DRAFT_1043198 [Hymenopellis radicata]|nr:hypothetical protein BDZ89DRAFT_1043198 [Hymenopellis radicata]